MIRRYTRPEMAKIWSDEEKFRNWFLVEWAVMEAKSRLKMIPSSIVREMPHKFPATVARIEEIDAEIEHDMNAFIMAVQEKLPPEIAREFHNGLTSYDVEEPALALQFKDAIKIIQKDIEYILNFLDVKANAHRWTIMAFRTHGQIAELGTLGIKMLRWCDFLERCHTHLEQIEKEISVCKLSGAVGVYGTLGPEVEKEASSILGLTPARIASQILYTFARLSRASHKRAGYIGGCHRTNRA